MQTKMTLDGSKAKPDLSNSSWAFRFALVSAILVLFFTMLGPIGSATVSQTSAFQSGSSQNFNRSSALDETIHQTVASVRDFHSCPGGHGLPGELGCTGCQCCCPSGYGLIANSVVEPVAIPDKGAGVTTVNMIAVDMLTTTPITRPPISVLSA